MKLVDTERQDIRSATLAPTLWLMLACSGLFVVTASATAPGWWSSRGATSGSLTTNDYAAVVQGQVKQFTARAVDEMNANLTNANLGVGGAGSDLTTLVAGWTNEYYTNGYNATNHPASDYQAMTTGQLKYIASLYYGQLVAAGYTAAWPGWLYPNSDSDNQMVTIGQLKTVFNFDISGTPAAPINVTVTTLDDGSVELTWQGMSPNVTDYTIQRSDDSGSTWTTVDIVPTGSSASATDSVSVDVNDVTVAAADAGSSGSLFKVTANNGGTTTPHSTPSSSHASSPTTSAPAAPSGLTVTAGSVANSFNLAWQDNSGGAASFVIQGSKDGSGSWMTLTTATTGTTTKTVQPDSTYLWIFKVYASQSGVQSASTDIVSADGVDTDLAPHYALIDIAPGAGMFVNNSGQAVYQGTNSSALYQFWDGGTSTTITTPATNIYLVTPPAGLNNGGTVALGLDYPEDTNSSGGSELNLTNRGTALWTNGAAATPLTPISNLLTSSLSFGGTGYTNGPPGDPINTWRGNYPTGLNDSNTVIGEAQELGNGPYWAAGVALKSGTHVGDVTIFDAGTYGTYEYGSPVLGSDGTPCSYLQGGRAFNLTAINNSGRMIGTYVDITTSDMNYLGIPVTAAPMKSFYGTSASDVHPLIGLLTAINDNGVISGTDIGGTTNLIWLPKTGGGYNRKIVNYTGAPGGYVNNKMQTASGWQDYRVQNWSTLTSSIPTNWSSITGVSISHDSGIIVANAMTNSVQHAVLLVPCGFRLLNGSTNNADVDGKDFSGNRPTTISATTNYNPEVVADIGTNNYAANAGIDKLGVDTPFGQGRGDVPDVCYTYSLMMLAKVAPASSGITYGWNRVAKLRFVTIAPTATNTWYVTGVNSSSYPTGIPTPIPDHTLTYWDTHVPSTNNNVVVIWDDPAMNLAYLTNYVGNANLSTNTYAYHKIDFTYSLTNSIGSAYVIPTQDVGVISVAKKTGTNNVIDTDWVGVSHIASTTNIPDCSGVTTNEIRAIVGGTNAIIFNPNVTNNY